MHSAKKRIKLFLLLVGDGALFFTALFSVLFLRYYGNLEPELLRQHLIPFSLIFIVWFLVFGALGLYDQRLMKNGRRFLYRLLQAMGINTTLSIIIFYLIPFFEIEPRRNLFLIVLAATLYIFIWRYIFNLLIIRAPASKILFFGITGDTMELADYMTKNPQLGWRPVAFMSVNGEDNLAPLPLPYLVPEQDLRPIIQEFGVDTIVISREIKENKTLVTMLFQAIPLGVGIFEFPAFYEATTGKIPLSLIGEVWFLENLVGIKRGIYEFIKRLLDFAIAAILIVPSAVIFPFIALAIKLSSEGPVFFQQKRVGKNGKVFDLIKYRTMVKDAENFSGYKGVGPDSRHTSIGTFLRKSYLDELPQIINVLRGEMSFIGPRPERPQYIDELKAKIPFYEMRLLVPPGITGWAQINMEDDASVEDAPEKMQYDLYYIKNRSAALDLLIVLKTLFTLVQRSGR